MNKHLTDLFFALIQVSLGSRERLDHYPSNQEWDCLYRLAKMQSLTGVVFRGLELTVESFRSKAPDIFFEWIGTLQYIRNLNSVQNNDRFQWIEKKRYWGDYFAGICIM